MGQKSTVKLCWGGGGAPHNIYRRQVLTQELRIFSPGSTCIKEEVSSLWQRFQSKLTQAKQHFEILSPHKLFLCLGVVTGPLYLNLIISIIWHMLSLLKCLCRRHYAGEIILSCAREMLLPSSVRLMLVLRLSVQQVFVINSGKDQVMSIPYPLHFLVSSYLHVMVCSITVSFS